MGKTRSNALMMEGVRGKEQVIDLAVQVNFFLVICAACRRGGKIQI
jgi:hypothetical protein